MSGIYGEGLTVVADAQGATPPPYPVANLNGGLVRLARKTKRLEFDDAGYPGAYAVVHLNPRRAVMDQFRAAKEGRETYEALESILVSWNIAGDDGNPLPITAEVIGDLPDDLFFQIIQKFVAAFNGGTTAPKALNEESAATSTTSE